MSVSLCDFTRQSGSRRLTSSSAEIFGIAEFPNALLPELETPFIPAKAGIQSALGPRFRGDERTLRSSSAVPSALSANAGQPDVIAFAALPMASTLSPASRNATMRQGQASSP